MAQQQLPAAEEAGWVDVKETTPQGQLGPKTGKQLLPDG